MGRKKKRLIIMCIIFVLVLGAVISFFVYMKGNEYSKIALNALNKEQQKNVIGGGYLSHVETIKPKNRYVIPDDPVLNMEEYVYDTTKEGSGYIVKDAIILCFKEWVPEYIAKEKFSLLDGVDAREMCENMYIIRIKGISLQKLNKLVNKLNNNDIVVKSASQNSLCTNLMVANRDEDSYEDIKNTETEVVTFYYVKKSKLYRYIVYVVKKSEKTYVIDTQGIKTWTEIQRDTYH